MCINSKILVTIFILFQLFYYNVDARTSDSLKVTLSHGGKLVGRYLQSHDGKGIRAFLGIPYAEPPIGELRFKSPLPKRPWDGEISATEDPNMCMHRDPYRRDLEVVGSEDCLYLNVYAPYEANRNFSQVPVMVWFHGGGWQCGSGIRSFYGPNHLLDHEIIYVSGNFRLGPLGFLSTETADCPGNYGMKDQVLILKWVQQNIRQFGGDPNQVTIFGESAGGASGTLHMQSKLSKGLFKKVIAQSGVNLNPWAMTPFPGEAAKRAVKLSEIVNCNKMDAISWNIVLECMRKLTGEAITKSFYEFFTWDTDPMIPFPPVVEPEGPDAFITENPLDVITPISADVPMMIGLTSEEGALKSASLINEPHINRILHESYKIGFPIALYLDHHSTKVTNKMFNDIMEYYFPNGIDTNGYKNLTNVFTDNWFAHGIDEYLRNRLEKSDPKKVGPTYVYYFMHKGAASFTEIFKGGKENYYGACHAEELQYLFPIGNELFISATPTIDDIEMRRQLTSMWVTFARKSVPVHSKGEIKWTPAKSYPPSYLRMGNMGDETMALFSMEDNLLSERLAFWHKMQPHSYPRKTMEVQNKPSAMRNEL